jgi:DNA topoisomerase-6 subunit A
MVMPKRAAENVEKLCEKIYNQLKSGNPPQITMPSRSTDNIIYDPQLRQYILGDKRVKRSVANVRNLRPFTQLVWIAKFGHELLKNSRTSTLRDVYYSAQAYEMTFKDQSESDNIITDLETVLGVAREDMNIFPEERSAVFGDLTVGYTVPGYVGKRFNLTEHPDGVLIGPSLTTANFVKTTADKVIAIEKGGIFTRFIEESVYKKFNAILIQTGGQAPRTTRTFIRRLNDELKLPVYLLMDGDPWGMHIAMVIISGSANAAHLRELNTPDAKWIGVTGTDILTHKLPSDPLTANDLKRLNELKVDPRYSGAIWQKEIDSFLTHKRKSELEAFNKYGLTAIVDKYLPTKLE